MRHATYLTRIIPRDQLAKTLNELEEEYPAAREPQIVMQSGEHILIVWCYWKEDVA